MCKTGTLKTILREIKEKLYKSKNIPLSWTVRTNIIEIFILPNCIEIHINPNNLQHGVFECKLTSLF